ncbi:MAG: glutaredoxin family protein [Candidatus Altiarchaeota archaeon]|nr:glutaredoxin family protein [Candidatus Altiarchaeota archaeon]
MDSKYFTAAFLVLLVSGSAYAESCDAYFVFSTTCPHCSEMKSFVKYLNDTYENLTIRWIDVSVETQVVQELAKIYNTTATGVPRFYIGNKAFVGYSKARGELEYDPSLKAYIGYQNQINDAVIEQLGLNKSQCTEPPALPHEAYPQWNIFLFPVIYLLLHPIIGKRFSKRFWAAGFVTVFLVSVFAFIALTPEQHIREFAQYFPFPVFVAIISFADGFNPCAFTVLVILLSLLTHTKSKKKMSLIGGVFILASAVMYFIFIMSLMTVGSWIFTQYGDTILKVLGTGILIAGCINLKDYFYFKKGISLTLSSKHQMEITKKASKVVRDVDKAEGRGALVTALFATTALAFFVNLVELGCTAILPLVYMTTLFQTYSQNIGWMHVFYTGLYSLIYVTPLLAILVNFIYYFKSDRITEDQGKILKLAGGLLMVVFGAIMLAKPQLLSF